jgi:quinol monooxygenase YgiN
MDARTVRLSLTLAGRPGTTERILDALRFITRATRFETGCLGCEVWTEPGSLVHYREEWATESDMRRRVRSHSFTSLLAVMETACEPPEVRFESVAGTRGLDYVAELRYSSAR